ncbi:hypothetical protein BCR42DRAFT_17957 [Absidia repens]|uniref:Uncharacterized protein n=1 Tax=Absidia repens TaxID=90262 RepID=A0A1X2J294_9FUNG|nr:hypothetical protein BCR42DRAFT_17957 [Absidia repens]
MVLGYETSLVYRLFYMCINFHHPLAFLLFIHFIISFSPNIPFAIGLYHYPSFLYIYYVLKSDLSLFTIINHPLT